MARAQQFVDRAVQWIMEEVPNTYASPIIDQGKPDQGDALSWRLKDHDEKHWFRSIDVKEAHAWKDSRPPESWGGLMLATEQQLHSTWIYIVFNEPMTVLAFIDMEKWSTTLAETVETNHPEGGQQVSMKMPIECFKFVELT
jgi:hypothetical protein